jgi:phenylacetate-CoA ligase
MAKVTGRSDDMLIIRGVNVFPTQIEEILLADERLSPHYILEVRREGPLDQLTVAVEMKPELAGAGEADKAACAGDVADRIKGLIGVSAKVRIAGQNEIERSIGKAKRVNDLRDLG